MTESKPIYNILRQVVDEMPAGLDRAVLRVLTSHIGKENAIHAGELINAVRRRGYTKATSRNVRAAITGLRKEGYPIAAWATEEGGYYICRDILEFDEFAQVEYVAKIRDMQDTLTKMRVGARQKLGNVVQPKLAL